MDAAFLTSEAFWRDPEPFVIGFPDALPEDRELREMVLFETSGSTGRPKWVVLSKEALLASAAAVNTHLGVTASSCWGLALPVRHVGGFGVAARSHLAGCRMQVYTSRWNPGDFARWVNEREISHTSLVPTQVHDLVAAGLRAPRCLRAIVVGGGRLEAGPGQAARDLGWPVLASYGMTEAGSQIATQPMEALASIYQPAPIPPLPIWNLRLSPEGRLLIAGPALFSGTIIPDGGSWIYQKRSGVWHETTDLVSIGPAGLTPAGRADTLVKVLGELVDPARIEGQLIEHAEGRLAPGSFVVIATPDERMEHALVPVFDASVDPALIAEVLARHHARCAGFQRLAPAVTLTPLPRGPLGKPLRAEILKRIR